MIIKKTTFIILILAFSSIFFLAVSTLDALGNKVYICHYESDKMVSLKTSVYGLLKHKRHDKDHEGLCAEKDK